MDIKLVSVVYSMRRWSALYTYALERFGCPAIALKTEQRDCIKYLYEGKDVFLWLPTGFGKSLCYEVLPFVLDDMLGRHGSVVIVISPLVSLMVDQVQSLRQRSVNAAIMSSGNVDRELMVTDEDFSRCSLLFSAVLPTDAK